MFQIIILICSMELSRADCQSESALDVIRGPEVASEMMCGFHGQAFLASTSLVPRPGRDYVKLQCVRVSDSRHGSAEEATATPQHPPEMRDVIGD